MVEEVVSGAEDDLRGTVDVINAVRPGAVLEIRGQWVIVEDVLADYYRVNVSVKGVGWLFGYVSRMVRASTKIECVVKTTSIGREYASRLIRISVVFDKMISVAEEVSKSLKCNLP